MISQVVLPVNIGDLSQYGPDILGALFFAGMAYVIYKFMPKSLLLVLVVLAVVLLYAERGK
jgi:hypothetical protein